MVRNPTRVDDRWTGVKGDRVFVLTDLKRETNSKNTQVAKEGRTGC